MKPTPKTRPPFDLMKAQFIHRYTCEHVPEWAKVRNPDNGRYYAPQYRTDLEWYENTLFPGEEGCDSKNYCISLNQSFPLGGWLGKPFQG